MAKIGIKTADGGFYPICSDESAAKKRVRLAPAHEHQNSVQIDLFRGDSATVEGAEYIGSLLLEHIEPTADGEREIDLILRFDEKRDLQATANDLGSGSYQSFSVNIDSIDEAGGFDIPDFSLDEDQIDEVTVKESAADFDELHLDSEEENEFERDLEAGLYEDEDGFDPDATLPEPPRFDIEDEARTGTGKGLGSGEDYSPEVRRLHPLLLAGIILIVISALGLITFGIYLLVRNGEAEQLQEQAQTQLKTWAPVLLAWTAAIV